MPRRTRKKTISVLFTSEPPKTIITNEQTLVIPKPFAVPYIKPTFGTQPICERLGRRACHFLF